MPAKGWKKTTPDKRDKSFRMRISEEDLRKLFFLARLYNEQSAADFLTKFIRNEYDIVIEKLDKKQDSAFNPPAV